MSSPVVAEPAGPVLADAIALPSGDVAETSNESPPRTRPTTFFVTWTLDVMSAKATPERAAVLSVRPIVDGVSAPTITPS